MTPVRSATLAPASPTASASGEAPTLDRALIGEGADATIHRVPARPDLVAKVYREAGPDRRAKLEAMLAAPPERRVTTWEGRPAVELAWPVEILSVGPEAVGFLMPAVDLDEAVLLEHVLTPRARRAARLDDGVRFRVAVAANLAASVAALHARGHHVVDLKPANLHVYRRSGLVAILDCDGMSIAGPDGTRFPAHQYTDGYIAPEAVRERRPPEALGELQDRFALAVVVFQLLCDGLHPFQGVPADPAVVPTTNGERIGAGLYPYGSGGSSLAPPPKSAYPFLDAATQALFTRAFDRAPESRPSAAEWRDHLRVLLDGGLGPCERDPAHARFGEKLCAACENDPLVQRRRRREALAARRPSFEGNKPYMSENLVRGVVALFALMAFAFASIDMKAPLVQAPGGPVGVLYAIEDGDPEAVAAAVRKNPSVLAPPSSGHATEYDPLVRQAGFPRGGISAFFGEDHLIAESVLRGTPQTTATLLALGADPNARDPKGRLPLHHAAGLPPFTNAGVAPDSVLIAGERLATSVLRSSTSGVPTLFHPVEPGWWTIPPTGSELVWVGTLRRQNQLVDHAAHLHLIAGATDDVDVGDRYGRTALAYAAASGNGVAILTLLRLGADPNLADEAGVTPLMQLADRVASGNSDALAARLAADLIVAGADPDQRDNAGRSAYRYLGPSGAWDVGLGTDRASARLQTASLLLDASSIPEAERDLRLDQAWAWSFFETPRSSSLAETSADVDDAATQLDFAADLAMTFAATLSRPPWVDGTEVSVVCRSVPPATFTATLQLERAYPRVGGVQQGGVGERGALDATDWIDRASIAEEGLDPDLLAQRAREARERERCLARAGRELPRRFDIRGDVPLSGSVPIRVTAP